MMLASRHITSSASNRAAPIKVMIADDSAVVRGLVNRWLEPEPDINVVAAVSNGLMAVNLLKRSGAEVVILDVEMPVMDGLHALPKLLEEVDDLKIIVASTPGTRNAQTSMEALENGAADFLPKPEFQSQLHGKEDFRRELLGKVRALGGALRKARGEPVPAGPAEDGGSAPISVQNDVQARTFFSRKPGKIKLIAPGKAVPNVLAIGASTGGPKAICELLGSIDDLGQMTTFVTQHMPATFTKILAQHIARAAGLPAREATDGEQPEAGQIYIAPGGFHMLLEAGDKGPVIRLDDGAPVGYCRPAVDPMLESIAQAYGDKVLCVILTGMGSDGVAGARAVVKAGGTTLAQDETSSVVWGMPGAVAAAGLCAAVEPLSRLGAEVSRIVNGGGQ